MLCQGQGPGPIGIMRPKSPRHCQAETRRVGALRVHWATGRGTGMPVRSGRVVTAPGAAARARVVREGHSAASDSDSESDSGPAAGRMPA